LAQAECHDAPWLIDELVPSEAAVVDDIVVGREDAVREPVIAHKLPDVFDRVELWALGRQWQQGDVGGDRQRPGHVPTRLIEHENGMGTRCHLATDLGKMQLHRLTVAMGHDEPGTLAFCGAYGTEDPGRGSAQIAGRDGPGSTFCPAPGELGLLANPGFVLPPNFYTRSFGEAFANLRQTGGELFLKTAISARFCA